MKDIGGIKLMQCSQRFLNYMKFSKIFYSGRRDSNGRSQIGFSIIEIIADEIFLRKETSIEPVLEPGERGCLTTMELHHPVF